MITAITTVEELQDVIRESTGRPVLPVGAGTKPALSADPDANRLDLCGLRGIREYDPAELTVTALAGTPVAELAAELARHGQALPFDPPFMQAGATLGGAVAAGASGPGAFRHGGVREFVIGVRMVDGTGTLVAGGGKVVKNAAGFDLPKLMVGSLGRLGALVEVSLKIFPYPESTTTLECEFDCLPDALSACCELARGPIALEALDLLPDGVLLARIGGDPSTLDDRAARLATAIPAVSIRHGGADELELWRAASELEWVPADHALIRVPITAPDVPELAAGAGMLRCSLGANVAWIAWPPEASLSALDRLLAARGLTGAVLRGDGGPLIGRATGGAFGARLTSALDPHNRFPRLI